VASKKATENPETENNEVQRTLVFVGDKQSGKSSLILKYLNIQTHDNSSETVALDFKYATKKLDDLTVKVNSYELGGGQILASMLQASINVQNISKVGAVCIVLDLTKPGNCVESLLFWLSAVREHIDSALHQI